MFDLLALSKPKKRLLFNQLIKWIECDKWHSRFLISGIRKTGKTTLFAQIAEHYNETKHVLYLNFREEHVYDSKGFYNNDPELVIHEVSIKPYCDIILLDEITCLEDFEIVCSYLANVELNCNILITGSSPFHIRALSSGIFGGGRSKVFHLPTVKFVEYLHFTREDMGYSNYQTASANDFENYLFLKGLPMEMRHVFDNEYFLDFSLDVETGDKFMRNRHGNSKIRSNVQSLANILAYHLSGRIEYYKLTNFNVGKRELVGHLKKYRSFSKELGNTLVSISKNNLLNLQDQNGYNIIALLLKFLWKSYILNAETDLRYEGMSECNAVELLRHLDDDAKHSDLVKLFD